MKVSFMRAVSIALSSLAFSSVAFGVMDMDSRVTQLENQMKQVHTETAIGTFGAETASARLNGKGTDAYVQLDILCWHARFPDAAYAATDSAQAGLFPIQGEVKNIDFDWDFGFRVGLGYNFAHDSWNLGARYTYFQTTGSDSESALQIIPLQSDGKIPDMRPGKHPEWSADFLYCTKASSTLEMTYQTLDLDLGRAFFVSKYLSFRPFWGVKTGWIKVTQTTRYTGGDPLEGGINAGQLPNVLRGVQVVGLQNNVVATTLNDTYWSIGPRVGCDSKWHMGAGFSIEGDVAASLLYGFNKARVRENYSQYPGETFIDVRDNFRLVTPVMEMKLGIRYDTNVNDDKQHFGVGFGYDTQYWFPDDIMLYGFTLDFRFDF